MQVLLYYDCKNKNLKHVKPKNWWSAVKKISGMDTITKSDLLSNLQIDDLDNLSNSEVANKINDKFLEPLQEFQSLQITVPNNDSISNVLTVSELDVWNCLTHSILESQVGLIISRLGFLKNMP